MLINKYTNPSLFLSVTLGVTLSLLGFKSLINQGVLLAACLVAMVTALVGVCFGR